MAETKPSAESTPAETPKAVVAAPGIAGTNQDRKLHLVNEGDRRVIVGPGPKSLGGGEMIRFDTKADENAKIPSDKRLGRQHTVEGRDAETIRSSPVFAAMGHRLGLRAS